MNDSISFYKRHIHTQQFEGKETATGAGSIAFRATTCECIERVLTQTPVSVRELTGLVNKSRPGRAISESHIEHMLRSYMLPLGVVVQVNGIRPFLYHAPPRKPEYASSFEELPKQNEPAQAVPVEPSMAPSPSKHSTAITYGGVSIEIEGQMVDATAMWRACGAPENLRPSDWLALPSTGRYLEKVCEKLNAEKSGICKSAKGRGGGTSMHRLVALHYAGALDVGLEVEIKEYYLAGYDGKPQGREVVVRQDAAMAQRLTQLEANQACIIRAMASYDATDRTLRKLLAEIRAERAQAVRQLSFAVVGKEQA